ncbi:MAG: hypothetical protein H7343_07610, partial [Undibacterium sp.]|nr:hypothetical protein [Opitutaceae bacterium]
EPEAARIKGEALLAAGKTAQARATMAVAYRRGGRDPDLLAAIGLLEVDAKETATAKKFLELVANGKTTRSRALVELAKLRLIEALGPLETSTARLSAAQMASVLTPLFAARELPAATPQLYATIARAWENSAINPESAHLAVLDEGVKLFPRKTELVYRTALLKARIGLYSDSAELITLGLQHTTDPEARPVFDASLHLAPGHHATECTRVDAKKWPMA